MGFSSCGENLRQRIPTLMDDSTAVTSRRTSLTSDRTSRMDDGLNWTLGKTNQRLRWVNLRHRNLSQKHCRTLRMNDRPILSYERDPLQPG